MANPVKATPRQILTGVNDLSRRTVADEEVVYPQFLALAPLFTYKGDSVPRIVSATSFNKIYGAESLDVKSPYYTHQTHLVKKLLAEGGAVMVAALKPNGSKFSRLDVYIEQVHRVTTDGQDIRTMHSRIIAPDTSDWIKTNSEFPLQSDWPDAVQEFRDIYDTQDENGVALIGADEDSVEGATPFGDPSDYSTLTRLFSVKISSEGIHGNLYGIRLISPSGNAAVNSPLTQLSKKVGHRVYSLQLIRKDPISDRLNVVPNRFNDPLTEVVLAPNVYHPDTGVALSIDEVLKNNWRTGDTLDTNSNPIGSVDVNYEGLAGLRESFATYTLPSQSVPYSQDQLNEALKLVNFMDIINGIGLNGVSYPSITVKTDFSFGSIHFKWGATSFFRGGFQQLLESDLLSDQFNPSELNYLLNFVKPEQRFKQITERYELEVYNWLSNIVYNQTEYSDMARYPFRDFVDSGFSHMNKDLIVALPGMRKDVNVYMSTYAVIPTISTTTAPAVTGLQPPLIELKIIEGLGTTRGVRIIPDDSSADTTFFVYQGSRGNGEIIVFYEFGISKETDGSYSFLYGSNTFDNNWLKTTVNDITFTFNDTVYFPNVQFNSVTGEVFIGSSDAQSRGPVYLNTLQDPPVNYFVDYLEALNVRVSDSAVSDTVYFYDGPLGSIMYDEPTVIDGGGPAMA